MLRTPPNLLLQHQITVLPNTSECPEARIVEVTHVWEFIQLHVLLVILVFSSGTSTPMCSEHWRLHYVWDLRSAMFIAYYTTSSIPLLIHPSSNSFLNLNMFKT